MGETEKKGQNRAPAVDMTSTQDLASPFDNEYTERTVPGRQCKERSVFVFTLSCFA